MLPESLHVFLVSFLFFEIEACSPPRDGFCYTNSTNDKFDANGTQDISAGSCQFQSTFCKYSQGCLDNATSVWKMNKEFASLDGFSSCYYHRSMLISPFLCIPDIACLQLEATILRSSVLEVFLESVNGSIAVITKIREMGSDQHVSKSYPLQRSVSRILFSGKIGGQIANTIHIKSVYIEQGSCIKPNSQHTIWQTACLSSESTATTNSIAENSSESDQADGPKNQNEHNSTNVGVIVGSVIAVLAIVAVVVGVIAWKKTRNRQNRNEDNFEKHSHQQSTSVKDIRTANSRLDVITKVGSMTVDDAESMNISINRNNLPYTTIGFEPNDTHAYDRIPDGGHSEKPRFQESDHYDLIKSHPGLNELIGGKDTSNLNRMNLTKKQTGAPIYSVVQTNRHTPKIVHETVDDYNRIDLENHTTGKESGAAALNVYNKLKSPLYEVPPSCKIKSLKPAVDTPQDDYNKLDYKQNLRDRPADNENETLDECDSKLNAYSSLGNSTDTYTRVQSGKKDTVIASNYDHIV